MYNFEGLTYLKRTWSTVDEIVLGLEVPSMSDKQVTSR